MRQPGSDKPADARARSRERALAEAGLQLRAVMARLGLTALAAGAIAVEHGFYERPVELWLLRVLITATIVAHAVVTFRTPSSDTRLAERIAGGALLVALLAGGVVMALGEASGWRLVEAAIVVRLFAELWAVHLLLSRRLSRPEALLPISFVVLILVGTALLKLPRAVPQDDPIGWLDALFTSTSAVCVTGLTVRSTATEFTGVGQVIICVLIQLGGLGIVMFGSTLMLLLGRRMSLRENLSLSQMLADQPVHRLLWYGRFVLVATLMIELLGAAMLYPLWDNADVGHDLGRAWFSVFHSVSAFCNAGFDITGQSMVGYRQSGLSLGVIVMLIVLGGLGFPVLENIVRVLRARLYRLTHKRTLPPGYTLADTRLSLHSRLVLTTTAGLYLYGVLVIVLAQALPTVEHDGSVSRFAAVMSSFGDAHFTSITARTAGFNSVPMDELAPASVFAVMTLMIVGGSPGSTAGGMKTTTLAVLMLSVIATMRQRPEAESGGRAIADSIVRKAGTLGLCYFGLIVACTLVLAIVEPFRIEAVLFEVISAATTTGLSLGITGDLSPVGRVVIIAAMFLGRVGPLTLLTGMLLGRRAERPYSLAHEDVALG